MRQASPPSWQEDAICRLQGPGRCLVSLCGVGHPSPDTRHHHLLLLLFFYSSATTSILHPPHSRHLNSRTLTHSITPALDSRISTTKEAHSGVTGNTVNRMIIGPRILFPVSLSPASPGSIPDSRPSGPEGLFCTFLHSISPTCASAQSCTPRVHGPHTPLPTGSRGTGSGAVIKGCAACD